MSDEKTTEAAIIAAGKTAPRITPADIDAAIDGVHYFTALEGVVAAEGTGALAELPDARTRLGLLTICVLRCKNGYTILGKSACADPANFDAAIGRDLAYKNAREQLGPLLGFELCTKLATPAT